jgi:N-methylhydantoinase A/oxoprolinase/acetone carboxylase beta subunit
MSACAVAEKLGVAEIIVPRMAAVFSAFGIGFSDIAHTYDAALTPANQGAVGELLEQLTRRARRDMFAEGFELSDCTVESSIGFTRGGESGSHSLDGERNVPDHLLMAQDVRVQLRATKAIPHFTLGAADTQPATQARTSRSRTLNRPTPQAVPLFRHEELRSGQWAVGPAIVEEDYFTCVVSEGWRFLVNDSHDLVLNRTTVGVES